MRAKKAEIIVVGFELLNGTTLDTNSHWLSQRLAESGVEVTMKTTVGDNFREIKRVFDESLSRSPDWIFSIGGLGPTHDDLTITALGRSLELPVRRNQEALRLLVERYKLRARLTGRDFQRPNRSSLKMARLPEGAKPLRNRAGSAPGVFAVKNRTRIVAFPGVPRELRAIFTDEVRGIINGRKGRRSVRQELWFKVQGVGESKLARDLAKLSVMLQPQVYVKSHPTGFKKGEPTLNIQLIGKNYWADPKTEEKMLVASASLEKIIKKLGGGIFRRWSV